ncbi:MAG: DUF1667 domain-containing protein [Lachnospiraceae bacterium]|nr:DUF1667 domain-containing protein [Lachnospiraceae bacterium]
MESRTLTCIGCPMGCQVTINYDYINDTVDMDSITVTGNTCPRGREYAISEITNPTRTVTGTITLSNRDGRVAPVKTKSPIPKSKVSMVAEALMTISMEAPVKIGDVVINDICDTGVEVVVTNNIE